MNRGIPLEYIPVNGNDFKRPAVKEVTPNIARSKTLLIITPAKVVPGTYDEFLQDNDYGHTSFKKGDWRFTDENNDEITGVIAYSTGTKIKLVDKPEKPAKAAEKPAASTGTE